MSNRDLTQGHGGKENSGWMGVVLECLGKLGLVRYGVKVCLSNVVMICWAKLKVVVASRSRIQCP